MHATLASASHFTGAPRLDEDAGQHATTMDDAEPLCAALDSRDLLKGRKTVTIVHNGASYRLQATKLGKLILTK